MKTLHPTEHAGGQAVCARSLLTDLQKKFDMSPLTHIVPSPFLFWIESATKTTYLLPISFPISQKEIHQIADSGCDWDLTNGIKH